MNKLKLAALTLAATIALAGCASTTTGTGSTTKSKSTPTPKSTVSKGLAAHDATGDVKVGVPKKDPDTNWYSVPVTIVNHSSKRSDYMVDLALESANGATQYDTTTVIINALEAGQTATDSGQFFKDAPAGAKVVLKSVERTASV